MDVPGTYRLVLVLVMLGLTLPTCFSMRNDAGHGISTVDTPYGLHLSFGGGGVVMGSVRCIWATGRRWSPSLNGSAVCRYGLAPDQLHLTSGGLTYTYTAGNFTGSLHEVTMVSIPRSPGSRVYYQCGSDAAWSDIFNFTIQAENVTTSANSSQPWIGVICDMGVKHSEDTVSSISKAVKQGNVQAVVHGGDISYANDYDPSANNAYIWQDYFNEVSHFAAYVPYMTCPGNHEAQFAFAGYLNWLRMPDISGSPFYHSFDYMGIHFLMFSTEHDFSNGSAQHGWMVKDLQRAHANRENVPWIIVIGHRPLYCSDLVLLKRCVEEAPVFRGYIEDLLNLYRVDVYISGHNHQYERSYPVYNLTATAKDYVDPKAPVYIVDGAAGCKESIDPSFEPSELVPWRAHHSDYFERSWLKIRATPKVLQFQLTSSADDRELDSFEITRSTVAH
ncbi:acid phosphatase type 7-like [Sycon ciliatum]|uniref:acid phosphatase type 7-like n=1 Tax=Sycon ciliatum TaxID=27933 RepID=UPI0031F60B01